MSLRKQKNIKDGEYHPHPTLVNFCG